MYALAPAGPTTTPAPTTDPTPAPSTSRARGIVVKVLSNETVRTTAKRSAIVSVQLIATLAVCGSIGMLALMALVASTVWNMLSGTAIQLLCSSKTQAVLGIDVRSARVIVDVSWCNDVNTVKLWDLVGGLTERAIEWVIESAVVVRAISRA